MLTEKKENCRLHYRGQEKFFMVGREMGFFLVSIPFWMCMTSYLVSVIGEDSYEHDEMESS